MGNSPYTTVPFHSSVQNVSTGLGGASLVLAVLGVIDMKEHERLLNGPTFWKVLLWRLYSIDFIWLVLLFSKGLKTVQKPNWPASQRREESIGATVVSDYLHYRLLVGRSGRVLRYCLRSRTTS